MSSPGFEQEGGGAGIGLAVFFGLMLRAWWLVLLVVLVTIGAAVYATSLRQPVYRAEATFVVIPSETVLGSREATINSINVLDRRTISNTFAEVARSQTITDRAARQIGLTGTELADAKARAVVLPETFVVQVSVEDLDPERAATLANAIVQEAGEFGTQAYPAYQARQLDQARPQWSPIRPQPVRDVTLAGVGGLAVGVFAAVLLGYIGSVRRSSGRVAQRSGRTVAAPVTQ